VPLPPGFDTYPALRWRCDCLCLIPRRLIETTICSGAFCDLRQLTINLGKRKVMIFNGSKKVLLDHHFLFRGEEIQITITYTYLGVELLGPRFSLRHALHPFLRDCVSPSPCLLEAYWA